MTRSAISRRTALKALAAGGVAAAWPGGVRGETEGAWVDRVVEYLGGLAKADGGYGWEDQEGSHLTPTFAVVGCYRILGRVVPERERVARFVRGHHPGAVEKLEQAHREFDYQQIQALLWLGEEVGDFAERVRGWRVPTVYMKQYERHGWPVLRHETAAFVCRGLLGLGVEDLSPGYVGYLEERRRGDGSFNNTPAAEGGGGNVLNTWYALEALGVVGKSGGQGAAAWLKGCQLAGGGFTHGPGAEVGGVDDVAYTWAGVRALGLLGEKPRDGAGCVRYLQGLWNADGGFGDRAGWGSNPVATYYALSALETLGALERRPAGARAVVGETPLPVGLKVFSIQIEAHGQGSPAEAVDLAGSLGISLWGAKNATAEWIGRCQGLADEGGVPVRFFVANEEYGTWVDYPGLGTYSHTSDVMGPAGKSIGGTLAGKEAVSWGEFRKRRLEPLVAGEGRLVWQFGENEALVRQLLDDSIERGGYAAISTFHFGNPDFTHSEPFLMRYRGRIPLVALQDAHGKEPWWFADMTEGFRTLFLATEPTWEGWLNALKRNWVVAVRRDAASGGKTWMHGGSRGVVEFVKKREGEWRWWENSKIARPLVSVVVVRAGDGLEVGRPEKGVAVRVRCAWTNTKQGLPLAARVELRRLEVDGVEVVPVVVAPKQAKGKGVTDHYHYYEMPDAAPGRHQAVVTVEELATGKRSTRAVNFLV